MANEPHNSKKIKIKLIFLATLWRLNVLRQIEPMNPNDHPLRTTILNFSFIHKRVTLASCINSHVTKVQ
jgi:hypothetical protein